MSSEAKDLISRLEAIAALDAPGAETIREAREVFAKLREISLAVSDRDSLRTARISFRTIMDKRKADLAAKAATKRRIVKVIEEAAASPDARKFKKQVEGCRTLWKEIGNVGGDDALALNQSYRDAIADFRKACRLALGKRAVEEGS